VQFNTQAQEVFMMARLLLSVLLLVGTSSFASNPELDDLMTPDELAAEVGITEPTDLSPQIEPFTPAQIYDTYGVDVYSEFPVVIVVSKGSQTATVYHNGSQVNSFLVSTGREKYERAKSGRWYTTTTPTGWFSPKSYVRKHWSGTWDALMEYAIFFNGGVALHATTPDHYKELGHRASGGCVRMHKTNAIWFWDLSLSEKTANVPYFTRGGQILRNRDGSIKRHNASGTLVIVTSR
jgi:lipoprotein-anchoring transpeptidase ErfK/SrfK